MVYKIKMYVTFRVIYNNNKKKTTVIIKSKWVYKLVR